MPDRNLADPAFEPSDEQLAELTSRAFAHVAEQQRQVQANVRKRILALRLGVRGRYLVKSR